MSAKQRKAMHHKAALKAWDTRRKNARKAKGQRKGRTAKKSGKRAV